MKQNETPALFIDSKGYFDGIITEAIENRKIKTYPSVKNYLTHLLQHFMVTQNLYDIELENGQRSRSTLAEMFLKAVSSAEPEKSDLLKKLADTSLYVSGFFSDSLQRKVVDVDYYVEMGENAYGTLAEQSHEDLVRKIYEELAKHYLCYMDVLTYISQKAMVHSNASLLRLYETYLRTGSELAKEQLLEKGILQAVASEPGKSLKQQ